MNWADLLDIVQDFNAWTTSRVVRRYQRDLITGGLVLGPLGLTFRSAKVGPQFLLTCVERPDLSLVATGYGSGFPITSAALGAEARSVRRGEWVPTENLPHDEMRARLDSAEQVASTTNAPTVLVVGHRNFAHFIWNQLPALIQMEGEIAAAVVEGRVEVVLLKGVQATVAAVGGLDALVPSLAGRYVVRDVKPGVTVGAAPLGSLIVSSETQRRVREVLSLDHPAFTLGSRVLWLSVRSPPRSPSNQTEYLVETGRRWLQEHGGQVVIDGFTPTESPKSRHVTRARSSDVIVGDVRAGIESTAGPGGVFDTRGLRLREALSLARYASFYVSPMGSIQHKVGWVWNPPGIVHVGVLPGRGAAVRYHGNHVEGGVMPVGLPERFVEEAAAPPGAAAPNRERNVYYEIVDVSSAAEWTVSTATDATGASG